MSHQHIYDRLLQFPLFLGMSHNDMIEMAGHTKLEFYKLPTGKSVVKAGEACHHLHLLTNGSLRAETKSTDGAYRIIEDIPAPYIIQPYRIFGTSQRFTTSFTTSSASHFIAISKREVINLSERFLTFRLNLLSLFAARTQSLLDDTLQPPPPSLRGHLVRFFRTHSSYPAGRKEFRILMQQLALEVNDSRTDVSRVLNQMQSEGLLSLSRGRITIHDITLLR